MRNRADVFGYAGMLFLVAAGLVRLILLGSGALALGLLVVGIALLVTYFFRAEQSVQRFLGLRSTQKGGNVLGTSLFVLGIAVLLNLWSSRFHVSADLTADRIFTLAPETAAVLKEAPLSPEIWVFYPQTRPETLEMTTLLEAAQTARPDLRFHVVDPDRDPIKALEFKLQNYATVVQVGEQYESFEGSKEEDFLAALLKVYRRQQLFIGFLTGHGEVPGLSREPRGLRSAAEALNRRGITPFVLNIIERGTLAESLDVVVIAGLRTAMTPAETDSLQEFMNRGGRLLVLLDPVSEVRLPDILGPLGLGFDPRFLADPDELDPQLIHPSEFTAHPVSRALTRSHVQVVLPGVGEVTVGKAGSGIRVAPLMRSGGRTVLAGDSPGEPRARILAAAAEWRVESGAIGRAILVGDADFPTNRHFETLANADLFLSMVQWLTERESLIDMRPRGRTNRPVVLTKQQGAALMVLVVGLLPLSVLGAGIAVWWRRR